MRPAGAPSAGDIGVIEFRVKTVRPLVRHDQLAVLYATVLAVQLPIWYRAVIVVLLSAADQAVSVRHLRRNDRECLYVAIRQDLRVLARHYLHSFLSAWTTCG